MTEYYLSDQIIVYNGKYYKKNNLVTDKNWHNVLSDIGWSKLDKSWIIRFNSYIKTKSNSKWGILDTDNNGDCFFSCISEAINNNNKLVDNNEMTDMFDIRKKISEGITQKNFDYIMDIYNIENEIGEFNHKWDIKKIKDYHDLRKELNTSGHNYWADHIIIQLFQETFKLNLIILNKSNNKKYTKLYPLLSDLKSELDTVILYYIDQSHFKLIGHFNNNKINTIFKYNELPLEILKVYDADCR
tara:strand:+ start:4402 stop:5133 length:732 start_codon:yes stop_codon:yes gene_type:complete